MKALKKRRAAVLIFILYATLFVSLLLGYVTNYALVEMRLRAPAMMENSIRHDAYNVLYAALSELKEYQEIDKNLHAFEQGWGSLCTDGRAMFPKSLKVKVKVTDETAKLPFSKLTDVELKAVFYEIGLPESSLDEITDLIMDWTDEDDNARPNGAERNEYDSYGAFPPNRQMKNLAELKFVKDVGNYFFDEQGIPTQAYKQLASCVSLYNTGNVNLNTASELVLRAVYKMEELEFDTNIMPAIRGESGSIVDGITWLTSKDELLNRGVSTLPARMLDVTSTVLRLDITVSRGAAVYVLTAICSVEDSNLSLMEIVEGGKDI